MITNILNYILLGGWSAAPILAAISIGFFLFFLRFKQLSNETKQIKKVNRCLSLLSQNNKEELSQEIATMTGSIGQVMACGYKNSHMPKQKLEDTLKEAFYGEYEGINRHLGTIQMLANLLPLLGLVGTITGIIAVFKVVGVVGGGDPQAMGAGISEALVSTQLGLIGAIPLLIGHHILSDKAEHITVELKRIASAFVNHAEG